jgi:membrane-associated PAP2 superfamily phosphatase
MSLRQTAENVAQVTTPVPISVSGLTFMGVTFQDWVFIATAILLVFQLIVIAPKAMNVLKSIFKWRPKRDRE